MFRTLQAQPSESLIPLSMADILRSEFLKDDGKYVEHIKKEDKPDFTTRQTMHE